MGSRTDLAEREVTAQRARVASMLGDLEERVQEDAHGLGDALGEQTSGLQERVSGAVDELPGRQALDEHVAAHPLTALLGAVGVGVALGVASSFVIHGGDDDGYERERSRRVPRRNTRATRDLEDDGGSGLLDTLTGIAMSSLAGPVKHEMQTLARQALAGFLGEQQGDRRTRQGGPSDQGAPGSRSAPREEQR